MLQIGQTYFKNLAVLPPQNFEMSDHFTTLCMKVLNKTFINSIMQPGNRINFQLVLIDCRPCEWNNWVEKRILFRIMNFSRFLSIFTALSKKDLKLTKNVFHKGH